MSNVEQEKQEQVLLDDNKKTSRKKISLKLKKLSLSDANTENVVKQEGVNVNNCGGKITKTKTKSLLNQDGVCANENAVNDAKNSDVVEIGSNTNSVDVDGSCCENIDGGRDNNGNYDNSKQDVGNHYINNEIERNNTNSNDGNDRNGRFGLNYRFDKRMDDASNDSRSRNDRYDRYNKYERNNRYNNNQEEEEYVINTEKVMYVKDLREKTLEELLEIAEKYQVQNLNRMLRQDIITAILKQAALAGEGLYCDGFLEIVDDGFGFLRDMNNNYKSSSYDVYISQNRIKRLGLRQGDMIGAYIKEPRRGEKYFSVARLETINGKTLDEIKNKINFDNLIPLYPTEKLKFDYMNNQKEAISTRVIDLICPIGKGQRALIVAPPRTGKTFLMQAIAHAINENHPEVELIVLLIDERPEEVTDMQRTVKGEVVSSTFDEPAKRHVELAEVVIEKAKRMVEEGKDVIILLDSITRLARAYNAVAPSSGKVLTGGVDSNALQKPKRFFGAARNIENGGSLTIIATALVETGSKMDEVIFEEFKGTGNAEIVLDRKLADKRLFPAIDVLKSGTRKEEEMVSKEELQKMWILRRILITMAGTNATNSADALEFLLDKLKATKNNKDFFVAMNSSGK